MRKIRSDTISNAVKKLCAEANFNLPVDVLKALRKNVVLEEEKNAKDILKEIIENANIARKERIPLCQDTGIANFFVKLGKNVFIDGKNIYYAINRGVSMGYKGNYLRNSIVSDPIERKNTNNNTPANIYIDIVSGDKIKITFLPKGGGSENACALKMLIPSLGWCDVERFIVDVVSNKGKNACPPLIIGIGIGGDFASVSLLSKKALLRKINSKNKIPFYAEKEMKLLNIINSLNIGPMNLGGKTTALAVFIESRPTHIASFPVAVSIQCHSCKRSTIVI
ncbi:MAG: fumarate hydratase [Endomicrobium sp.]|jgi:fumarate hydratase subunit alpha|nr:fumarate hydratase [Endomicrobium sp.]